MNVTSSFILSDHDRASIHAFLGQDINNAQKVDFDIFIDAVFGLSSETMKEWSLKIRELNWLEDPDVKTSLESFCSVTQETDRYQPLAILTNRIIELARGSLPGIPNTFPIDDIRLVRNDPICIQTIPEHGPLGALRKPDLVMIRAIHANLLERPAGPRAVVPGIKWSHSMVSWELKGHKNLASRLAALLEDRRSKCPASGGQAVPLAPPFETTQTRVRGPTREGDSCSTAASVTACY